MDGVVVTVVKTSLLSGPSEARSSVSWSSSSLSTVDSVPEPFSWKIVEDDEFVPNDDKTA